MSSHSFPAPRKPAPRSPGSGPVPLCVTLVVLAAASPATAQGPPTGPPRFAASGDFRLRSEYDLDRVARPDRARPRIRFRVGGQYELDKRLSVAARLVTAPNLDDPNSTHQDLGRAFKDFPVALDRAFLRWRPPLGAGLAIVAGKFGHPFAAAPVFDELVWDADIQPEGLAAVLEPVAGLRIIAAEYLLLLRSPGKSLGLTAGQVAWRGEFTAGVAATAAVGGYAYQRPDAGGARFLARENQGNALTTDAAGDTIGFASDFTVVHGFAALHFTGWRMPVMVAGQYVVNARAASSFDKDGFALGFEVGALDDPGTWVARYQYQELGQEAVFSAFAQDDFLDATNLRGHLAGVAVRVLPRVNLYLWGLLSAPATPRVDRLQKRLRLDVNVSL